MRVIRVNSTQPLFNLSLEEAIFKHYKPGDVILLIWRNNKCVVLGYSNIVEDEVCLKEAKKLGVRVVRRITGGGAVYHDLGNLNFSVILSSKNLQRSVLNVTLNYKFFSEIITDALSSLGLDIDVLEYSNIMVNGFKVSGAAQRISGEKLLYHFTLLHSADLNIMNRVLKNIKFPTDNISSFKSITSDRLVSLIIRSLERALKSPAEMGEITIGELIEARKIYEVKRKDRRWNIL